jgi:hypothetical protein
MVLFVGVLEFEDALPVASWLAKENTSPVRLPVSVLVQVGLDRYLRRQG